MRREQTSALALVATASLAFAACGSKTAAPEGNPAIGTPAAGQRDPLAPVKRAQRGGDMVIARGEDVANLDPTVTFDNASIWVQELLFEPLYYVGADGKTLVPWLAKSYSVSDDKLTYEFKLRDGLKFSDGSPLTAKDAAYSIQRCKQGEGFGYLNSAMDKITAPDPTTVRITLKKPWAPLVADVTLACNGVTPANLGGKSAKAFFKQPVSSGPFVLDRFRRGQDLRIKRNPNYWQKGKPYLDSVDFKLVADDNTRVLQLKGGDVQETDLPFALANSVAAGRDVTAAFDPSTRVDYLLFNFTKKPLDDVHVRRAIAYAIDRKALVKAALFNRGQVANSFMSPNLKYYDKSVAVPSADMTKAKQELGQSKAPKRFTLDYLVGATDTTGLSVAQLIQQQLAPLGIRVRLKKVDTASTFAETQKGNFDLSQAYFTMDIPDADELASFLMSPKAGGSSSYYTNYKSAKADKLVRAGQRTSGDGERARIYTELQQLHAEDLPQLPLYYTPWRSGRSKRLQNYLQYPTGHLHLENVWLEGAGS